MDFQTIEPDKSISLFVRNVWTFEESCESKETVLPFFADGYPGLIFAEAENGLRVRPQNKVMPALFLYGQTIRPIELHLQGRYKLLVFQLYPFVLRSFFNVEAKDINDGCYDLEGLKEGAAIVPQLLQRDTTARAGLLCHLLLDLFTAKKDALDFAVREAVQVVLNKKGLVSVGQLCKAVNLTERTFERRFQKEVGLSPKQFSRIIQFQQSLGQLTLNEYAKLTDVVYANGFAEQSHFIRVFKSFTGKTPKQFKVQ